MPYRLIKTEHAARRGQFETVHGTVQTPAFMNVATAAAIKGGLSAFPTRTNGVTIWTLSQLPTRRNCSTGEDAGYPRQDGKTPWSFTVT